MDDDVFVLWQCLISHWANIFNFLLTTLVSKLNAVIDLCKTISPESHSGVLRSAGHPPWYFESEDCHAPAGRTASPFQAD